MVDIKRLIKKWEKEWQAEKRAEVRETYNRLIDALQGVSFENAIAAIKLVEQSVLCQKVKQIYPELFK